MSDKVYRYISFESFVDIVQSKSLTFVSPFLSWDDTYEGILFRALQSEEGRKRFFELTPNFAKVLDIGNIHILVKALCWTTVPNLILMWSIYSCGNKSVMIQTSKDKITELKSSSGNPIRGKSVNYIDIVNLNDEIDRVFAEGACNLIDVFVSKRRDFEHEKEWRSFAFDEADGFSKYYPTTKVPLNIPCSEFIEDVLIHPLASDWYVEVVERFCKDNGISCSGKSQLYNFEVDI